MTLPAIRSIFAGSGDLQIRHNYGASDIYDMLQPLTTDKYLSMPLEGTLSIGGEFMRLGKMYVVNLYKAYSDQSTGVSFSGTWTKAGSTDYGVTGRLAFSANVGDYIELTTDDDITSVGACFRTGISGGGIALVSIDGDNTAADLLSTAQDLVDAGTLPNTVLVANGGTLNPTDRVVETHVGTPGVGSLFSSTLSAGVHTVRITVTGYKTAASANTTIFVYAMLAFGSGLYDINTTLTHPYPITDVITTENSPVWEISHSITPTGATGAEWVGHAGSLKFTRLPTITIDGTPTTLNKGQTINCSTAVFDMQFGIRHSEMGDTDLGLMDITYTWNSTTGLDIAHTVVWTSNGAIDIAYPAMMTLGTIFDRGRAINRAVANLDTNDNSHPCDNKGLAMWLWDLDGNLGALMSFSDYSIVENYTKGAENYHFYIDDDNEALWNKVRLTRLYGSYTYTNGEVWQSNVNYRIKWFADGANAALA